MNYLDPELPPLTREIVCDEYALKERAEILNDLLVERYYERKQKLIDDYRAKQRAKFARKNDHRGDSDSDAEPSGENVFPLLRRSI